MRRDETQIAKLDNICLIIENRVYSANDFVFGAEQGMISGLVVSIIHLDL